MKALFEALDNQKLGIFESPTGTVSLNTHPSIHNILYINVILGKIAELTVWITNLVGTTGSAASEGFKIPRW
jgi:hypothetical protein